MSEQNGTRRNVVIVMYQYSVIVKTIERKLQELRYEVEILAGEFDKIAEKAMDKPLFLVYLPKNFVSDIRNISSLNLILDIISKKGAEMILLGEGSDYADVMMQVPLASDYEWISRPLKVDEFTLSVMKHTRNKSKRILIVDDDPAYAKMLRECLKDEYIIRKIIPRSLAVCIRHDICQELWRVKRRRPGNWALLQLSPIHR